MAAEGARADPAVASTAATAEVAGAAGEEGADEAVASGGAGFGDDGSEAVAVVQSGRRGASLALDALLAVEEPPVLQSAATPRQSRVLKRADSQL